MPVEAAPVRVSVLGPPDLLVTALVAALRSGGVEAERVPLRAGPADPAAFPRRGPGVVVVDVDTDIPAAVVAVAVEAGLTVLAIGSETHRERAAAAVAAGAVGWIGKTSSVEVLADAVRAAGRGLMRMSAEAREAWLAEHRRANESVRAEVDRLGRLSPREREVLGHLAEGRRAAEIAELLHLSIATVRSHIHSILVKLEVNSQQQAADLLRDTSRRLARLLGTGPAP